MRVLWLSVTPSLFNEGKIGAWIASLENIVHLYLKKEIHLGIVFESAAIEQFKIEKNNTTYYPIRNKSGLLYKVKTHSNAELRWRCLRPQIISAINDFQPDIIHCFGSEWPFGAIIKDVEIPIVIHMQGFLNIYNMSKRMVISQTDRYKACHFNPRNFLKSLTSKAYDKDCDNFERQIMKMNHYFMGRTQWDKNIVKYYSPGAKYYYVPEAIRPDIYNAVRKWKYNQEKKLRLITITQAGYLKGNEIILRTSQILKELIGVDFEWRVAGKRDSFPIFEKKTGIKRTDVNVNLLGMIGSDQIVEELANADFYIHPAIIDNSPNSLCEAQLVGCPVIAANVGGIPQLVEDGKTGFLYPYYEPHTLAFIICNLMGDEVLLTKISNLEIEASHKRHNPRTVADSVFQTYEDVIADYQERIVKKGKIRHGTIVEKSGI